MRALHITAKTTLARLWALLGLLVLVNIQGYSQLTTAPPPAGPNYTALVQNFFVGTGIQLGTVTYNGAPGAIGSFAAGANTGFGTMSSGIIMSTGLITNAPGAAGGFASSVLNRPGIPQLNAIAGSNTADGATLTIQFTTQSNQVTFRYIFASEEYPEFVNTSFNDAFAFFISGPGITGQQNIAVVPGTSQPITIDNINQNTNSQYYVNNANSPSVRYDGRTVVMTATAAVQPCQTYTLTLMIADGGDSSYDSAVFLGDNSLVGGLVQVSGTSVTQDNSAIEGCFDASLLLQLAQPQSQPTTVNFTIGGTATNGVDYTTVPTTVVIPAGQTQVVIPIDAFQDNIAEGQETVTVTYVNPCSTTVVTFFINELQPYTVTTGTDIAICTGAGPVNLTASGTGGTTPYTITWTDAGGNTVGTGTSLSVNPPQTTTYTATITGPCPGQATDQQLVTVNTIPTSTFTINSPGCEDVAVTATYTGTATPGAQYFWSFPFSNSALLTGAGPHNITYADPGSYNATLTVVENNCTSPSTTVPITINATPTADFIATPQVCVGANATITFTGNVQGNTPQYTWGFDGGNVANGTGAGPYNINWATPGVKNVSLNITENGCVSAPFNVPVTVYAIPTATFTVAGPICEGSDVAVAYTGTGSPAANYTWNFDGGTVSSQTGQNYNVNYPTDGAYNLSLQVEENGCTSTLETNPLTVYPIPTANILGDGQVCLNASANLQYQGTASGNATYNWGFDGSTVNAGTNAGPYDLTWPTSGNKSITVSVTENGCTSPAATFSVAVFEIPTADFTATTNLCEGTPSDVLYTGTGTSSATYNWNYGGGSQGISNSFDDFEVNFPTQGTYTINLTVTENGCTSPLVSQQVIINGFALADAGPDITVCEGMPISIGTAPNPAYSYEWVTNLPPVNNANQAQVTFNGVALTGSYGPNIQTYTVQVTSNGCVTTDDVVVTVNPNPQPTFTIPAAQCVSADLYDFLCAGNYSNTATFGWAFDGTITPSSNVENPTDISFDSPGFHNATVTVTDNGCVGTFTAPIEVLPDPVIDFVADITEGCAPLRVVFTNLSGFGNNATYFWDFGDGGLNSTAESPIYTYLNGGTFDVTLMVQMNNSTSCKATLTKPDYITVYANPIAGFTPSPSTATQSEALIFITDNSIGGASNCSYEWASGSIIGDCNPTIELTDTGLYVITQFVANDFGCQDTAVRTVRIFPDFSLYVPNSFTPRSGDILNDYFIAKGMAVANFRMVIFNRWGQQIFASENIDIGWDGSFNGTPVDAGVYPYKITYQTPQGEEQMRMGSVTLIR